jgi:glucosyl-3-phosphoglycerate synthase
VPSPDALAEWFACRTFTADDLDLPDLIARKRARGLSVSLVLPARNESETVRGVVEAGVALAGQLVDEVVVLDGASTDGTPGLAAAAGATVHQDSEILPQFGRALGKGDALWRSLTVTSGDIVAFVDTDIRNPDPRFVWGIVAPLLLDDGIGFVKGFYDRPLEVGGILQPSGGGRVTELTARPLLNLFWPSLAGMVQPLSGEYAGRRDLLEQVPFFTGYGVELGMLIDTLRLAGPRAIGQVDLDERIHRNQSLEALSRMAFGIAQVAMRRLAADGRLAPGTPLPETYLQFTRAPDGVERCEHHVEVVERPPLRSLNP